MRMLRYTNAQNAKLHSAINRIPVTNKIIQNAKTRDVKKLSNYFDMYLSVIVQAMTASCLQC